MRYSIAFGATLLASLAGTTVANHIAFEGFPNGGTYHELQSFDKHGNCPKKEKSWTGATPLDEELAMVFRGPIWLKQVAVYSQATSAPKKRSPRVSAHQRRRGHQHFHGHNKEARDEHAADDEEAPMEKRKMTSATIDGKLVTFDSNWDPQGEEKPKEKEKEKVSAGPSPAAASPVNAGSGNWGRVAYYDAESGHASGLAFLSSYGGGTGVIKNVLGYVTSDGKRSSSSSAILENALLPDNYEIVISSDKRCDGDECGAAAPGTIAHHGFGGENKMFVAEYTMPYSQMRGELVYPNLNPDRPGFWLLNQRIVNAQQYGCSCWATGCGEWDVHEVLKPGGTEGVVALHMGKNYASEATQKIARPGGTKTMKIAAILAGNQVQVHVLGDDVKFDEVMQESLVKQYLQSPDLKSTKVTLNPPDVIIPPEAL